MKNETWKRLRRMLLAVLITSTVMCILFEIFKTNSFVVLMIGWGACIFNEFLYCTFNKWTVMFIPKDKAKIVEEYIENNKPLR